MKGLWRQPGPRRPKTDGAAHPASQPARIRPSIRWSAWRRRQCSEMKGDGAGRTEIIVAQRGVLGARVFCEAVLIHGEVSSWI